MSNNNAENGMVEDGYIKFNCEFVRSSALASSKLVNLKKWRDKLYTLGLIGAYPDGIGFGNISERIPGSDRFVITGSATGNIPCLDDDGYTTVVEYSFPRNYLKCEGPVKASSESLSHAAIYHSDRSVNAVIHIHHLKLWEYSINRIPTTSTFVQYGTPGMALEISRLFAETDLPCKKILVMGGHREGLVSFGRDLEEAGTVIINRLAVLNNNTATVFSNC